jgi:hypothetical protein
MAPFSEQARKEIMKRDKYTCQCENCISHKIYGGKVDFAHGFNIQGAHHTDSHKPYVDNDIENGKASCVNDHIVQELERGNEGGARLLHNYHTIRSKRYVEAKGDEKLPFDWYKDYAFADNATRIELIQTAQDLLGLSNDRSYQPELF